MTDQATAKVPPIKASARSSPAAGRSIWRVLASVRVSVDRRDEVDNLPRPADEETPMPRSPLPSPVAPPRRLRSRARRFRAASAAAMAAWASATRTSYSAAASASRAPPPRDRAELSQPGEPGGAPPGGAPRAVLVSSSDSSACIGTECLRGVSRGGRWQRWRTRASWMGTAHASMDGKRRSVTTE